MNTAVKLPANVLIHPMEVRSSDVLPTPCPDMGLWVDIF